MIEQVQPRPFGGLTRTGLATALFLFSEAQFFLALILGFFYLRAESDPARLTGGDMLDAVRAGVFTGFLILSSVTFMLAEHAHHQGHRRGFQLWLAATVILGVLFLVNQALEYRGLWGDGLTVQSNLFGTQFYTLTGVHFAHVAAGIVMLAILLGFALWGRPDEPGTAAVQPIGYYWHFVDVVWVIIYTVVYLVGA
jgi:heme/copper-type cytochrome/quinol oxidase subunit 3